MSNLDEEILEDINYAHDRHLAMTIPDRKAEIRNLAEKATQGNWEVLAYATAPAEVVSTEKMMVICKRTTWGAGNDLPYIAVANPAAIISILDDAAAVESERDQLKRALTEFVYETTHMSPLEDDGSHKCRITAKTLAAGRDAIALSTPAQVPATKGPQASVMCDLCGGFGFVQNVEQGCCGKLSRGGECRGDCSIPVETEVECASCGGVGSFSATKEV